ncbi:hypothetical protein HY480_03410, partial [Candidatus Uhrbacteria bacterium]|nr:hypothetical protein [Candidatus Uhrbacteria bacterium]
MAVLVLAGALIASLALLAAGTTARVGIQRNRATRTARALADAGVARAAYCFNQTSAGVCGNAVGVHYAGETNLALGSGTVTTTITSVSDTRKRITTTGRTTGGPGSAATVTITHDAVLSASPIGFRYGAQAGAQGVRMDNNSTVDGNVFANGSITGGNGTRITGDAIVAAGTPVTDVVRVDAMPTTLIVARSSPIIDIAQRFTVPTSAPLRTVTIPIKKIGSPPSASIRILLNTEENQPSSTEVARATLSSSSVFTSMAWISVTYTTQPVLIAGRTYWFVLDATTRSPNDYWMVGFNPASPGSLASADWSSRQWQDAGGTIAHRITTGGDTRIDGVAVGHDARAHTINRAQVNGSAWATDLTVSTVGGSAMASAIVRGTIGGNATARTISSSTIGGSVWCETITSSTVGGRRNCPVAVTPPTDPTAAPFPISTEEIQTWIADARAGGTITGNYEPPSDTTVSLGPKEIIGDLELDNGQHLIITGT